MKTDTLKKMLLMLLCVVSVNMTALGKELVSDVLPIADPYILFYNDTYYAYGTSRADGFEVYSSKDMKSWERSPRLALNKEDSYGDLFRQLQRFWLCCPGGRPAGYLHSGGSDRGCHARRQGADYGRTGQSRTQTGGNGDSGSGEG